MFHRRWPYIAIAAPSFTNPASTPKSPANTVWVTASHQVRNPNLARLEVDVARAHGEGLAHAQPVMERVSELVGPGSVLTGREVVTGELLVTIGQKAPPTRL